MGKVLILGAGGQIGRRVINLLLEQKSIDVKAFVRSPDQQEALRNLGVEVVSGDLEGDFRSAFEGCDQVLFTAGSGAATGPDKTLLIDLWAAMKAVNYAKDAGIRHFLMVSARGADNPDEGYSPIKPYLVAKHAADEYLIQSGVHYTVFRPGVLTDEPGTGMIRTSLPEDPEQQYITRDDVAHALVWQLQNDMAQDRVIELSHGSMPVSAALVKA